MVDVWLDVLNSSELVWYRAAKLAENIENSGNITLTMNPDELPEDLLSNVMAISVEAAATVQSPSHQRKKRNPAVVIGAVVIIRRLYKWYKRGRKISNALCKAWATFAEERTPPPCPQTKEQAQNDVCFQNNGKDNCYSSSTGTCCYR